MALMAALSLDENICFHVYIQSDADIHMAYVYWILFIDFVLQLLVIGLQAYAIILPSDLNNMVIGLCLCIAFHNYLRVICTVGIDAVRAMMWFGC